MKKNLLSIVFSALMVSVAFGQSTDILVKNWSFEDSTDGTVIKVKHQYMTGVLGWASVDTTINHNGVEGIGSYAPDGGYDGLWAAYLGNKSNGGDSGIYQVTGEKIPAEGAIYSLDYYYNLTYTPVDTVYAVAYLAARVSGHNVRIGDTLAALMSSSGAIANTGFLEATLVSTIAAASAYAGDSLVIGFNNVALDHGQKNSWCHIDEVSLAKKPLVSVTSITASSISISPNPTVNGIKLMSTVPGDVTICDLAGKTVLRSRITGSSLQLDLSLLSSGIYVLQLTNGTSSKTLKIVKQ